MLAFLKVCSYKPINYQKNPKKIVFEIICSSEDQWRSREGFCSGFFNIGGIPSHIKCLI